MTRDNIETLRRVASPFLSTPSLSAREWLSLIGLLNSQEKFTQYGRTKLRDIQWCLKRQWAAAAHKLGQMVFVSDEVKKSTALVARRKQPCEEPPSGYQSLRS